MNNHHSEYVFRQMGVHIFASMNLTFAKSRGWMITLAKVAAAPPQTKGSNVFVMELLLSDGMMLVNIDYA